MAAGLIQTAVIVPVDLLKVRQQLQSAVPGQAAYVNPLRMVTRILRAEGIAGLYRGGAVTLLRDIPCHAVYFGSYELCRNVLEPGSRERGSCSAWAQFVAGGTAGALSWLAIYPIDVVKSRLQAASRGSSPYCGTLHCALLSLKEEGLLVFWRGLPATLSRAFIVNAALFGVYEFVAELL